LRESQKEDLAQLRLPTTLPASPYQQGGRLRSDQVVAFDRIGWPLSVGIGGRIPSESAEAVQRPTMKFVATKTAEQLDLQALHRGRERLVSQRTGIINQIRAFLLERGIAVRQGLHFLRAELSGTAWMSASKACRPRSRGWWSVTQHANG
jgi:hypothetical protein